MAFLKLASLAAVLTQVVNGLDLDTSSPDSIKKAATTIAGDLISLYPSNNGSSGTPVGLFGSPYYFWEDAAAWGALIDYYAYTNDSTYNSLVTQALLFQRGSNNDYMPPNQTKDEGNDDQSTWALACLDAAEDGFPNAAGSPSWLELATNVWNEQAQRWDSATCQGGLRWQIFSFNIGYDYKNSASNGQFFLLSARLAKMTGNSTFSQWADKSYSWLSSVGLIDDQGNVYDGTDSTKNCSEINHIAWSYNGAGVVYGSSVLYNYTNGSSVWKDRVTTLTSATVKTFASNYSNILTEEACETNGNCNTDQIAFKGIAARWLAKASVLSPFIHDQVNTILTSSAKAAAQACSGGANKTTCGFSWNGTSDDKTGLGEELNALSVIQSLLLVNGSVNVGGLGQGASNSTSQPGSTNTTTGASPSTSTYKSGAAQLSSGLLTIAFASMLVVVGQCFLL